MSKCTIKIKIRNFGPIKKGFTDNDGWLDIKKVTVFIGNQGSGKSTVAKLISTFMWLEKALIRGDFRTKISNKDLVELLAYHRIEDYLEDDTEIEYEGSMCHLKLVGAKKNKKTIEEKIFTSNASKLPKIMYVPAERNFLSSIENINKVSNLIVGSLQNYSVEFRNAQLATKDKAIDLPINNTKIVYDLSANENYLEFEGKRLKLSHASSGFHSIVPLYWVTKYLIDFVGQDTKKLLKLLSPDQTVRRNDELQELKDAILTDLTEKEFRAEETKINNKYVCKHVVNIVEEPEQNLYPTSQKEMLFSLLAFNNTKTANKLVITTHSPYIVNYLSVAVLANKVKQPKTDELDTLFPSKSAINESDVVVYELDETLGCINKLTTYDGYPSDDNALNLKLDEGNKMFSDLLRFL